MDYRDLIIEPCVTEKSNTLRLEKNVYIFKVMRDSNKIEIKKAVESIFNVTVTNVNTIRVLGKIKKQGKYSGRRTSWKKALVTLKAGDAIAAFEGV